MKNQQKGKTGLNKILLQNSVISSFEKKGLLISICQQIQNKAILDRIIFIKIIWKIVKLRFSIFQIFEFCLKFNNDYPKYGW